MSKTLSGEFFSSLAAASPPKPPPMITTRGTFVVIFFARAWLLCLSLLNHLLLLPASSQCLVQLNDGQQFIELCLHQREFRRKGVGFVGQDFQIPRDATVVPQVGKTRGVPGGSEKQFLLSAEFSRLAVSHQAVGNAAEGSLNRLLIGQDRRLLARLRETHLRAEPATGKDRLSQRSAETPCASRSGEQVG